MTDYFRQGHAVFLTEPASASSSLEELPDGGLSYKHCYLPYLAVKREGSTTTKTRVVFNASSKNGNGRSLNDNLLVGLPIEPDLVDKMMEFCRHRYLFECKVAQMYRQIRLDAKDRDFPRFVCQFLAAGIIKRRS